MLEAMENAKALKFDGQEVELLHYSARELCKSILDLAFQKTKFDESGFTALLYLEKLDIKTSEYVGKAVYDLIELGGLIPGQGDSIEDFSGLFDTSVPIEKWGMDWEPTIVS